MSLIDEITQLRDDSISSLDASHDYYRHSRAVWRLAQQMVRDGRKIRIRNRVTGNTVNEAELSGLARDYIKIYLVSATFQHFVSLFERFVFDFLRVWLTDDPRSLSGKQLEFRTVLDAADQNEIVTAVVQKEVLGVTYKRVADWFKYLEKIAQLGCPSQDQIKQLAEIKASRDVLVHNNGIANSIYVDKSMGCARCAEGDKLELPEQYHRDSWQLLKKVVTDLANAGIKKLGK